MGEREALAVLLGRCTRTYVNIMQPSNEHATKPTEWQYVIWLAPSSRETGLADPAVP
jgi:hypothetical protein